LQVLELVAYGFQEKAGFGTTGNKGRLAGIPAEEKSLPGIAAESTLGFLRTMAVQAARDEEERVDPGFEEGFVPGVLSSRTLPESAG